MPSPLSILIVNPIQSQQAAIVNSLKGHGNYEFICLEDVHQALELLKERSVDAIITALEIGSFNGWRFARMIRSNLLATACDTPVIMTLPMHSEAVANATARSYGVDAVIPNEQLDLLHSTLTPIFATKHQLSSRLSALLIHQDEHSAQQLTKMLNYTFNLQCESQLQTTWHYYLNHNPALVIIDASMEHSSAIRLVKKLLAHQQDQAIVAIVNEQDQAFAEQLLQLGVCDFIFTPLKGPHLTQVCNQAARRKDFLTSFNDMQQSASRLDLSEHRYRELYSAHQRILLHLNTIVMELGSHATILFTNPSWHSNTGFSTFSSIGHSLTDFVHKEDKLPLLQALGKIYQGESNAEQLELRLVTKAQQALWFECRFQSAIKGENDLVITASIDNIESRKQTELQLQKLALHDNLTGLYNRYFFDQQLQSVCKHTRREDTHALLYIDLDHFKIINDSKGHQQGDIVLKEITALFSEEIGDVGEIFRIGGDEFAIILRKTQFLDAYMAAESVCMAVDKYQFITEERAFSLSCSIGVTMISSQNNDPNECLRQADIALYIAKNQGRNLVHCYDPQESDSNPVQSGLEWGHSVRTALQQGDIELHYQAVWDIKRERIAYYEALLRLRIDDELVFPGQFIPALEILNDSFFMDQCVVTKAMEDLRAYPQLQRVAINLSAQSFLDDRLLPFIKEKISHYDIDPKRVIFEITESASVDNLSATRELICALNKIGCDFSIDDFGTGFSTFNYLKRLPAQNVKIDGSFVRDMPHDEIDRALVKAVNDIARSLNKHSVAEYVENKKIFNLLREIGVDYAQGYFIAKPAPVEQLQNNQKIIAAKTSI